MAVILSDCDGVACPLTEYLLGEMKLNLPRESALPRFQDITTDLFDPSTTPFTEKALAVANALMRAPGFISHIPQIPHSEESVRKIKAAGHQFYWLTAPHDDSPTWAYDRRIWLKDQFRDESDRVVSTHAKYLVAGDVFIDDKPRNIREWAAAHPTKIALLYAQPWNAAPEYNDLMRFTWTGEGADIGLADILEKL